MNFLQKIITKLKKTNRSDQKELDDYNLQWIEAEDNPWNIRVLDLRPLSQTLISTSENLQGANNALSYNLEDGSYFKNKKPLINKSIEVQCSIPTNGKLEEGTLFRPFVMEHKWAIFYRDHKIIVVRGWQRNVFVVADTHQDKNNLIITKIHGKFIFEEEPEEYTRTTLLFLLHSYCIGDIVPVPIPEDLIEDTNSAAIWVFQNFGNLADYGFVGTNFKYQTENNLKSDSLLHFAIAKEDINAINTALQNGFDLHSLGTRNFTPLQWSLHVNPKILIHLVQKGARVNNSDDAGETALMSAVELNSLEHIKLLIHYGSIVDAKNENGFTALHKAAEMGNFKIVKYLLEKGADYNLFAQGYSPLDLALKSKHKKVIRLLKKYSK